MEGTGAKPGPMHMAGPLVALGRDGLLPSAAYVRILVANDDGIYSPGLRALAHTAREFGDVRIVAPDVEQSSMGHAITHSRPLRIRRTPIAVSYTHLRAH